MKRKPSPPCESPPKTPAKTPHPPTPSSFPFPQRRGKRGRGAAVRGHFHSSGCPSTDGHERLCDNLSLRVIPRSLPLIRGRRGISHCSNNACAEGTLECGSVSYRLCARGWTAAASLPHSTALRAFSPFLGAHQSGLAHPSETLRSPGVAAPLIAGLRRAPAGDHLRSHQIPSNQVAGAASHPTLTRR